MVNVNCPLCKGAVWIPAKKAEEISPDELAKFVRPYISCSFVDDFVTAILEKYEVRRKG